MNMLFSNSPHSRSEGLTRTGYLVPGRDGPGSGQMGELLGRRRRRRCRRRRRHLGIQVDIQARKLY